MGFFQVQLQSEGLQLQLMLDNPHNVRDIVADNRQIERTQHLKHINNRRCKKVNPSAIPSPLATPERMFSQISRKGEYRSSVYSEIRDFSICWARLVVIRYRAFSFSSGEDRPGQRLL